MWKQFKAMNNIMAANWSLLNIPTIANFLFINLFGPRTNQLDLTKCAILWLAEGRCSAEVTACPWWELGAVSNNYESRLKHLLWFIFDINHLTRLMLKYYVSVVGIMWFLYILCKSQILFDFNSYIIPFR
jgi:hypothetical protein